MPRSAQQPHELDGRELERLRKIFDFSHDAGFLLHPESDRILEANQAACELLGYDRDELLALSASAIHPREIGRFRVFADQVVERGSGFTDELTCLTKAGDQVDAEISASTVDIDGDACVIAWVRDIRARKAAEAALRESEHRFRTLVQNAAEGIYVTELDGRFSDVNPQASLDTGYTREELIGKPVWDLAEGISPELFDELVNRMAERGPITVSNTHRRKDGSTYPVEVRACVVPLGDRDVALAMTRDVSDRLDAERGRIELSRAKLQMSYLREELAAEHPYDEIVGNSPAMQELFRQMDQVAQTDATVLIVGETGTGKELVARALHERSARRDAVLVKVNCAALSAGLIESELFGHEKGAFTGATAQRVGRFELADGGTIFLDEIGDLSAELQAKLLRVLQEGELERVGGATTLSVDVRVIAATNQDLERAVEEGRFRADLYYRLRVFPLSVPALRARSGDLALLVHYFVRELSDQLNKDVTAVSPRTLTELADYDWPGNVRELRNVIERAVITSSGGELEILDWSAPRSVGAGGNDATMEAVERRHVIEMLERCNWQVSGDAGAAKVLGLKPTTLRSRMKKLGIERP